MNSTETHYITISLGQEAYELARKFAANSVAVASLQSPQATAEKNRRVYLNTLAVCAVDNFVQEIGWEPELDAGDSWHSVIRMFHDTADLVIPNLGKIECRPVMPEDTVISLPLEVTEDRIAYVGVRFQEQLDKVELLGFIRAVDVPESATTIDFEQLEPIENLIDYLFRLESGIEVLQEEAEVNQKVQQLIETTPISVIVAQLERIIRIEPEYKYRKEGEKVMLSVTETAGGTERQSTNISREDQDKSIAAQKLGKSLLDKLSEIWVDPA